MQKVHTRFVDAAAPFSRGVQAVPPARMTVLAFAALCVAAGMPAMAQDAHAGQDGAAPAAPAPAADAPQKVQQVVVTGSSIRGVGAVGSPTLSVNRDAIAASGATTGSEVARQLPQVINLGADESRLGGAQDGAANTTRTSGINLRGIGNEATLLLVNGRRVAASGVVKALSDPNQVPAAAIQRIEVVLDGASAIYGSDAVAGVVNIITRSRVDVADTMLRYGKANGMDQKIFSQTFGKTWDKTSVFVAYEHNDRSSLAADARPFFSNDLRPYGGTDQRSTQSVPGNVLVGNTIYAIPAGQNGTALRPEQLVAGSGNRYDAGMVGDFLPSQKRDTLYANAFHNVNDKLEIYYEGLYSTRAYNQVVAPTGANLNVPATSPFFVRPAGVAPAASQTMAYRFAFDDPDLNLGGEESNSLNVVGLTYGFDNGWELNSSLSYGRTEGFVHRVGLINNQRLNAAVANGTLNPFSATAGSNPAFASLAAHRNQNAIHSDGTFAVKLDGPLARISGGSVRLAVGAEVRRAEFEQGLSQNVTTPTPEPKESELHNSRTVRSLYSELFVPLVGSANARPMLRRLELSLAARYERYSDFGSTTNPKVGVRWSPIDALSLNTTYGTSFRAPSLVDNLGSIERVSLTNIFVQNFADPTSPDGVRRGMLVNGGNPDLQPEKSKTWSFGAELRPAAGMSVAASWYKIDYTDRIDVVPGSVLSEENLFAGYITRNPSAAVVNGYFASPNLQSPPENPGNIQVIVDGRRSNLGILKQQGIDVDARYAFDSAAGKWMLGLNVAKILELERSGAPGLPFVDVLDTLGNPVSLRSRASVGWKRGSWTANAFVNYIGRYVNTALATRPKVSSLTTVDASMSYEWGKGTVLSLCAQNLFDRDPPVVINGVSSWDSQNATAVGRLVSLALTKKW